MAQIVHKQVLGDTSERGPALMSEGGTMYLGWKGAGNDNLNILLTNDGQSFWYKKTFGDASDEGMALAYTFDDSPIIGWKGSGNENLNLARVVATASIEQPVLAGVTRTVGAMEEEVAVAAEGQDFQLGIHDKVVFGDTTPVNPTVGFVDRVPVIVWKGSGNDWLNGMLCPGGHPGPKMTYGDATDQAPSLTSHHGRLFLAWKGSGNENLNVAGVPIQIGGMGTELAGKVILGDTTEQGPALCSHDDALCLAWKGAGNDNLNIMFSTNDGRTWEGKTTFGDASDRQPALASHQGRLFMAWKGSGNENLNLAEIVR